MPTERALGLIKFFKDPDKLQALIDGLFFCNTPEFYRISGDEGVSDLHESCTHAYRKDRGDEPVKLKVDGHEVGGITALTQHGPGFRDHWLHCWFKFSIPDTEDELLALANDIERMRKEFGTEYAFILNKNLPELQRRLESVTDLPIRHGAINYSDDKMQWSAACKPESYSYQREYRFLVGECGHTSVEPEKIFNEAGFSDLISKSPKLEIKNQERTHVFLSLDSGGCICDPGP